MKKNRWWDRDYQLGGWGERVFNSEVIVTALVISLFYFYRYFLLTHHMCQKDMMSSLSLFLTYLEWASSRPCGTSGARWCRGGHTGSSPWRSSSRPRDCRGCRGTHTWGWELVTNVTTSCHMSLVRTREAHNCESRLWYMYTWAQSSFPSYNSD